MVESFCPYCEKIVRVWERRHYDDAAEVECLECGSRHVVKFDDPDHVYFFYPPDIWAAFERL